MFRDKPLLTDLFRVGFEAAKEWREPGDHHGANTTKIKSAADQIANQA